MKTVLVTQNLIILFHKDFHGSFIVINLEIFWSSREAPFWIAHSKNFNFVLRCGTKLNLPSRFDVDCNYGVVAFWILFAEASIIAVCVGNREWTVPDRTVSMYEQSLNRTRKMGKVKELRIQKVWNS